MQENKRFMLDTNTVSYILKDKSPWIKKHLQATPMSKICISVITEAELLLDVAKKPEAKHLPLAVKEFLVRVDILQWDSKAAEAYANLRAAFEKQGKQLGNMDMLIAAHAVSVDATLVTNDKAFYNVEKDLQLADWTRNKQKEMADDSNLDKASDKAMDATQKKDRDLLLGELEKKDPAAFKAITAVREELLTLSESDISDPTTRLNHANAVTDRLLDYHATGKSVQDIINPKRQGIQPGTDPGSSPGKGQGPSSGGGQER